MRTWIWIGVVLVVLVIIWSFSVPVFNKVVSSAGRSREMYSSAYLPEKPSPSFEREGYDSIAENSFYSPLDEPFSTFGIDVDTASYANVRRFVQNGDLPPPDAVRIEEMVNYFEYAYPAPVEGDEHPFSVSLEHAPCPWAPAHSLIHVGLQGRKVPTGDLPPSNLVFLIDVSGSMNAAEKLPLLKVALRMLTAELRPQDTVAVAVYAGAAGLVLPPTSGSERGEILEAIEGLEAGGSTAGAEGIRLAYDTARKAFVEGGNNRVILATDGDFNVVPSSDGALVRMIEKERESGVFLSVLGFGMGNYQDSKMQKLADSGNGNHAYIDSALEAKKVLVSEFGGTLFTIAKDVKIQVEFNPARVKGYRLIGYENRLLAAEDFADDRKDAGELGSGHSVTAFYEVIPADSEEPVRRAPDTRFQVRKDGAEGLEDTDVWMEVKLRYKEPDGEQRTELRQVLKGEPGDLVQSSRDFRFAAAVAEFGLLLRESEHRGEATFESVLALAEEAKGDDDKGYREGFIDLVEQGQKLKKSSE